MPPFISQSQNTLHVLVRGPTAVNIVTSPLIVIGFDLPAMTVDDFYGANLIFNLATFLGIPASKIKVAKAVSEVRNRRKRDAVFRVSTRPAVQQITCYNVCYHLYLLHGEKYIDILHLSP